VSLAQDGVAAFPDAVSERATHHLAALSGAVAAGDRAVLILLIGRSDATRFVPAAWVDPAWAMALGQAMASGVEVWAFRAELSLTAITLGARIPVDPSG
jgi:sugar fermentation stimulation protein A